MSQGKKNDGRSWSEMKIMSPARVQQRELHVLPSSLPAFIFDRRRPDIPHTRCRSQPAPNLCSHSHTDFLSCTHAHTSQDVVICHPMISLFKSSCERISLLTECNARIQTYGSLAGSFFRLPASDKSLTSRFFFLAAGSGRRATRPNLPPHTRRPTQ